MRNARKLLISACMILCRGPSRCGPNSAERMTATSLKAALAQARGPTPPDLSDKNLANLDLENVDFRGANLSASVLNGAKLAHARLDRTNLTVGFLEGADLTGA